MQEKMLREVQLLFDKGSVSSSPRSRLRRRLPPG
jgi:hypothetical protein